MACRNFLWSIATIYHPMTYPSVYPFYSNLNRYKAPYKTKAWQFVITHVNDGSVNWVSGYLFYSVCLPESLLPPGGVASFYTRSTMLWSYRSLWQLESLPRNHSGPTENVYTHNWWSPSIVFLCPELGALHNTTLQYTHSFSPELLGACI